MLINQDLKEKSQDLGASFFGIADLSPAYQQILEQGGETVAQYPRAISIGIALQHSLVDPLPAQQDLNVIMNYRHLAYDVVNERLDLISSSLSGILQNLGYKSRPIPASKNIDHERHAAIFSHKLAASLSGLGWIGKSCLLITPQAGPRVRWATVLTTAPLEPTGHMMEPRCGECQDCVDICPAQAFTGETFRPQDPREVRFAAHKCKQHFDQREQQIGYSVCGLCLYVCPHGKNASAKLK